MINIKKVANDIKSNGKYDALYVEVQKRLGNDNPTLQEIEELVISDSYCVMEYKDLNRWGELSSVHVKDLEIASDDLEEVRSVKQKINQNVEYLRHGEEYEVKSKNTIYIAWTGFIALPTVYVIDNIVRVSELYDELENSVYVSFLLVLIASIWGYLKVKNNHKNQHERYLQTQVETRELVKVGLEKGYFTFEEVYLA
ncbi:MAG: hypothetical protein U9Q29_03355 [Campylobacterota bacterium]|nr:hypothetical protein [Campylobacterota bacterium]